MEGAQWNFAGGGRRVGGVRVFFHRKGTKDAKKKATTDDTDGTDKGAIVLFSSVPSVSSVVKFPLPFLCALGAFAVNPLLGSCTVVPAVTSL
jgi:hypothetical protein